MSHLGNVPAPVTIPTGAHPDNASVPETPSSASSHRLYFNVEHVRDTVLEKVPRPPDPKIVVCDLSPHRSSTAGARMLNALHAALAGIATPAALPAHAQCAMSCVRRTGRARRVLGRTITVAVSSTSPWRDEVESCRRRCPHDVIAKELARPDKTSRREQGFDPQNA